MSHGLEGKKVVITAAGQGIGRASAERFLSLGAHVYATDINEKTLSTLEATEAMLTMDPLPFSSIPGRKVRQVVYIALAFRLKEKSQSFSSHSRIEPA